MGPLEEGLGWGLPRDGVCHITSQQLLVLMERHKQEGD